MQRYVIGNWKSHKSTTDGQSWLDTFSRLYRSHPDIEVILAPSIICLENIAKYLEELQLVGVRLAAQDVSPFPKGSYTGAVAADMIRPSAGYVIVGHSERDRYFHETGQDVANKISEAVDSGLIPIVCVEEHTFVSRLSTLVDIECEQALVAYTPVDALNFNIAESPGKVAETVAKIRTKFPLWPVVYGGALGEKNVENYLELKELAGVFVGSASLDVEIFTSICNRAASVL
ncbi:MAG: triose-phosphate isomerase [Desulforhopalus sp.]